MNNHQYYCVNSYMFWGQHENDAKKKHWKTKANVIKCKVNIVQWKNNLKVLTKFKL